MVQYNIKSIMKNAWVVAHNLSARYNCSSREWFGYALTQEWARVKNELAFRPMFTVGQIVSVSMSHGQVSDKIVREFSSADGHMVICDRCFLVSANQISPATKIDYDYWNEFETGLQVGIENGRLAWLVEPEWMPAERNM